MSKYRPGLNGPSSRVWRTVFNDNLAENRQLMRFLGEQLVKCIPTRLSPDPFDSSLEFYCCFMVD